MGCSKSPLPPNIVSPNMSPSSQSNFSCFTDISWVRVLEMLLELVKLSIVRGSEDTSQERGEGCVA